MFLNAISINQSINQSINIHIYILSDQIHGRQDMALGTTGQLEIVGFNSRLEREGNSEVECKYLVVMSSHSSVTEAMACHSGSITTRKSHQWLNKTAPTETAPAYR